MATSTHISFEEYTQLPEDGPRYELDEGELLMVPSPAPRHNLIRQRIAGELIKYVQSRKLGIVLEEMDFRLALNTVRNPDVAFVTKDALRNIDRDRSPIEGAPALAVEVISPSNRAEDTVAKVHQYLDAGSISVWLVYPKMRLVEIHFRANQVLSRRDIREPDLITDDSLFPGFSMSLSYVFDDPQLD